MNAIQAAVHSARSMLEGAGLASANRVWLHTGSGGPCLRVHVAPGLSIKVARKLKDLAPIVPVWIEERENIAEQQGDT